MLAVAKSIHMFIPLTFLLKQAEECEIEEKLKELQDMIDAADFTLSRSFIYLVPHFVCLHFTCLNVDLTCPVNLLYNSG